MKDQILFPESALVILRQTSWNPEAQCGYEIWSGGLFWDDEFPRVAIDACAHVDSCAYRYVIGYRASVIRGQPREHLVAPWAQLAAACPQWPGFRPERCSPELRPRLDAEETRAISEIEALID